jgi:dipeptidase E
VTPANGKTLVEESDVVMVGGGNTFKLLHDLYQQDLFSLIQQKVRSGTPYIGWSAGANLTGNTICTTNDMPILQPKSFVALGFLSFQLNPHYYNTAIEGFHGETRDQRLIEYLLVNPGVPVVGLPEGTALQLSGNQLQLLGEKGAVLFQNSREDIRVAKMDLPPGTDLSFLLQPA